MAGAGGGRGKLLKRKGGEREGTPAIRAPIGSILQSLAAGKLRLGNQTIGGVGRHSMLTRTSYRFSRFERRRYSRIHLKTVQELAVRALLDGKDVLTVLPTGYGKSLIHQMFVCAKDIQTDEWQSNNCLLFLRWLA